MQLLELLKTELPDGYEMSGSSLRNRLNEILETGFLHSCIDVEVHTKFNKFYYYNGTQPKYLKVDADLVLPKRLTLCSFSNEDDDFFIRFFDTDIMYGKNKVLYKEFKYAGKVFRVGVDLFNEYKGNSNSTFQVFLQENIDTIWLEKYRNENVPPHKCTVNINELVERYEIYINESNLKTTCQDLMLQGFQSIILKEEQTLPQEDVPEDVISKLLNSSKK